MKQPFEGEVFSDMPDTWPHNWEQDEFFSPEGFALLRSANKNPFSLVVHDDYICYEYPLKLNIFSFRKHNLAVPVTIIGLPVSVDKPGFRGDFNSLVADYKRRKGIFVLLNLEDEPTKKLLPSGQTLGTCMFTRRFEYLSDYLRSLRSSYRRRLKKALKKGDGLKWRRVWGEHFTKEMYVLYLAVLEHSPYPLETLTIDFFRKSPGEIYCLFEGEKPLAFVQVLMTGTTLNFVFGGMDYQKRDEYDLYYNMLLKIIQLGIEKNAVQIDFGQTAEASKMRVGCKVKPLFFAVVTNSKLANFALKLLVPLFSYRPKYENCCPFLQ